MASVRKLRLTCVAILSGIIVHPASAAPAAPEECERARSEQTALSSTGAADDLAKGAEWARTNLAPERLKRVARWIELEEVLLFRCPRPKPLGGPESGGPDTASRTDEDASGSAAKPPAAGQKPAEPKAKATPKPKPKPKPADTTGEGAPAPVKPKPIVKKMPKVDDAYRPPAPFSGEEVQHAAPELAVPATGGTGLAP